MWWSSKAQVRKNHFLKQKKEIHNDAPVCLQKNE